MKKKVVKNKNKNKNKNVNKNVINIKIGDIKRKSKSSSSGKKTNEPKSMSSYSYGMVPPIIINSSSNTIPQPIYAEKPQAPISNNNPTPKPIQEIKPVEPLVKPTPIQEPIIPFIPVKQEVPSIIQKTYIKPKKIKLVKKKKIVEPNVYETPLGSIKDIYEEQPSQFEFNNDYRGKNTEEDDERFWKNREDDDEYYDNEMFGLHTPLIPLKNLKYIKKPNVEQSQGLDTVPIPDVFIKNDNPSLADEIKGGNNLGDTFNHEELEPEPDEQIQQQGRRGRKKGSKNRPKEVIQQEKYKKAVKKIMKLRQPVKQKNDASLYTV